MQIKNTILKHIQGTLSILKIFAIVSSTFILFIIVSFIIIIIYVIFIFNSLESKYDKYKITSLAKNNIEKLTQFINEIDDNSITYDIMISNDEDSIIGNDKDKDIKIKYNRELKEYLFRELKLNFVYFCNDKNIVDFHIDSGSIVQKGFYYSKDNSDLYCWDENQIKDDSNNKEKYVDVKGNNWRICIWLYNYLWKSGNNVSPTYSYEEGIYTEKIVDNWYYFEDCQPDSCDNFPSINYVADELKVMGRFDEIMAVIPKGSYIEKTD